MSDEEWVERTEALLDHVDAAEDEVIPHPPRLCLHP